MPDEQVQEDRSSEQGSSILGAIFGNGYMGGEIQAAFFQGTGELAAALKAFPDAIQVNEPGQAFNPLYRDRDGDTPAHPSPSEMAGEPLSQGSVYGNHQAAEQSLSPSEILSEATRGSVHGEAQQQSQPSPSDIASDPQAYTPEQDHGHDRGGRSM